MNSPAKLRDSIVEQIDRYVYQAPSGLVGDPWSPETVAEYLRKMRRSLVQPYLQTFELRETAEQFDLNAPQLAEYWVVAVGGGPYVEWYDPETVTLGSA